MNYTLTSVSRRFLAKNEDSRKQRPKGWTGNEEPYISLINMIVTKAIFSYLRDFQYPFVSCDILSNCRHYVSFGHETRVLQKK